MFKSNDSSKNKRKSFFFFGNKSETPTPTQTNKDVSKQRKTPSENKPPLLSKEPLQNGSSTSPIFSDDHKNVKSNSSSRSTIDSSINEIASHIKPVRQNTSIYPNNKDLNSTNPMSSATGTISGRRPPPPKIDAKMLNKAKSGPSNLLEENNEVKTSKHDFRSMVPMDDNEIEHYESGTHRRQRSEAEKLVDDIDEFLTKHKEQSVSPTLSISEDVDDNISDDPVVSPIEGLLIHDDFKTKDVPRQNPQYGFTNNTVMHQDSYNNNEIQSKRSTLISAADTTNSDNFSFVNTIADGSAKSIQQVQMNDINGLSTTVSNLIYNPGMQQSNGVFNHETLNSDTEVSSNESEIENKSATYSANNHGSGVNIINSYNNSSHSYTTEDNSVKSERKVFRVVNDEKVNFNLDFDSESDSDQDSQIGSYHNHNFNREALPDIQQNQDYLQGITNDVSTLSVYNNNANISSLEGSAIASESDSNMTSLNNPGTFESPVEVESMAFSSSGYDLSHKAPTPDTIENKSLVSSPESHTKSVGTLKRDINVSLVSGYVEELRLKYSKTSNFLQAPPDLPISLKQKNNIIRPQNVKVRIRTSSKQIGIKHGQIKRKLLSLETRNEDAQTSQNENKLVDHTKEFHNFMNKKDGILEDPNEDTISESEGYLKEIPGDDAYNSDDIFAPLRETTESKSNLTRSDTTTSYYTKAKQRRQRTGTLDNTYSNLHKLPTNIDINAYKDDEINEQNEAFDLDEDDEPLEPYSSIGGLHIANPESDSE